MQQNNKNFTAAQKLNSKKDNSFEELSKIGKKMVRNNKIIGDGEIIQVPGGHIIRATGGKDRHSKVYTSKGPRDRRVRLSANTAIQFYDVQDRLGYDRPSKAVDWLMKQAKDAIDKLEDDSKNHKEIKMDSKSVQEMDLEHLEQQQESANIRYAIQLQRHLSGNMATPTVTQSMADSMKSFFPLNPGTSLMEMQSYPHDHERINSRIGNQSEDLGLLLQPQNLNQNQRAHTNQELLLHHHHHHQGSNNPVTFEQNYQKAESWNDLSVHEENRVGFIFNPNSISQQIFSTQNSSSDQAADHQITAHDQREPLQSNYSNLIHSNWNERMLASVNQQNAQTTIQPCSYNLYFGSNFQAQEQIHGQEEDHSHCSQR